MNNWPKVAIVVLAGMAAPRRPSRWFAERGKSTNEAGRVGVLAGGAWVMLAERCRGRGYTDSHEMKGIGMGNHHAIQS